MVKVTYRPIENFPVPRSRYHERTPFRSDWTDTLNMLNYEIAKLGADEFVFELDLTDAEIRMDGMPRKDARPRTPAVVVTFRSRIGPLQFATDRFEWWHDNARAVALALEALRKIDRYGITQGNRQYTGWKAIEAASNNNMTDDAARAFISIHSGGETDLKTAYRTAAKRLHPDNTISGDAELFRALQAARKVLGL